MIKATPALAYTGRILLIEDRPEEVRLLLEALRSERFHISIAFEGMQGYGRAVAQLPDLILMDVKLGQTDGFAVCRLLKADPSTAHIPVIFITSSCTLEERLTGLREGAVDYIQKPFEPAEVLARMRAHLKAAGPRPTPDASPSEMPVTDENSDQFIVKAAATHVTANLARMPTLAEIARRVGTHEKRLTKAFRYQKGVSVFEFVREQRLALARKLLTQTPMSIADIAADRVIGRPSLGWLWLAWCAGSGTGALAASTFRLKITVAEVTAVVGAAIGGTRA